MSLTSWIAQAPDEFIIGIGASISPSRRAHIRSGVITSRGAHLYFRSRYVGNGADNLLVRIWRGGDEDTYNMEAEIRVAVREALERPTTSANYALPESMNQAYELGWKYVGASGVAANFARHFARGICQMVNDQVGGVLEVPFEAKIEHEAPCRKSR